jgi:hypothetical protein
MTLFRTAYERWVEGDDEDDMAHIDHDVLAGFRAAVAA